jgi:hypothetical protein
MKKLVAVVIPVAVVMWIVVSLIYYEMNNGEIC